MAILGRFALGLLLVSGGFGCASNMPRPIETSATLGRVVVYRNGVASFERRAILNGDRMTLDVPAERMDDLLKSLSVIDSRTGKAIPISFRTLESSGDTAQILIQLPKKGDYDLRISYVTESPAWKPTYRLKLSPKGGPARLESWAVVDNVSGEDWEKVAVGVGSTSALSFKYDLQSVRYVERETLSDNAALGIAPPTGGSPYAVARGEVQVFGNLGHDGVDALRNAGGAASPPAPPPMPASVASEGGGDDSPHRKRAVAYKGAPPGVDLAQEAKPDAQPAPSQAIAGIANRLKHSKQKVQVLGYARSADGDQKQASLERANAIRDQLIRNGVPADQVEAIGTGQVSQGDGARIIAAAADAAKPQQGTATKTDQSDEPLGNAYFLASTPLTIEKGHSAMVSMLTADVPAQQVYYYDPISSRGSKRFAFRSVLIENPSRHMLDAGPFTVYAGDEFLGEGLSEPIPAGSRAFIPFALDRKLIAEPEVTNREEIERLMAIERGILRTEARNVRKTKIRFYNRGTTSTKVYVRHPVTEGFALETPKQNVEKLRGSYLFSVTIPPNGSETLNIEETTPIQKLVDIRTDAGIGEVALYLKTASKLEPELKEKLQQVIDMHRSMADLQERITTVHKQMNVYRTRIDEINVQLVSLRKVAQANDLSRHLAKKMEEISSRLQKSTISVADLEAQLLTDRIALEDRLAELTLERRKEAVAGR